MDGGLDRKDEPGIQHRREDGEPTDLCIPLVVEMVVRVQ